ncbi:hypothetical protein [Streptomyces sp. NBC_01296]|uniref:hypothetical protein n=1 Tax=Streptomyces sp. NBC_01296 TaxID=2903816 RepID=UPI002E110F1A|nr:hypothetical protein OG299_02660 [Streptomyces sp. NBC_01296]
MTLWREDENEVLSHPNSYLAQAGQDLRLVRKGEAKGRGGTVPSGHEVRLAVIPPTILLAPFPVLAGQATAGWWIAAITGGAWSCSLALATSSRYRIRGIAASATLLLASLVVLYH